MVGREAPFRPPSGREAPIFLNLSNWHPFFEFCFFFIPFLKKTRLGLGPGLVHARIKLSRPDEGLPNGDTDASSMDRSA
jgi:hypothetical protein